MDAALVSTPPPFRKIDSYVRLPIRLSNLFTRYKSLSMPTPRRPGR